eukprot:183009_1
MRTTTFVAVTANLKARNESPHHCTISARLCKRDYLPVKSGRNYIPHMLTLPLWPRDLIPVGPPHPYHCLSLTVLAWWRRLGGTDGKQSMVGASTLAICSIACELSSQGKE